MVVEAGAPTDKEKRQPEGGHGQGSHGQGSDGTGGDLLPIKLVPKAELSGFEPNRLLYVSNNEEPISRSSSCSTAVEHTPAEKNS